ncbi:MAG: hypothetical protein EXR72_15775 [Myxococcales bacterium]|nr:hypothetical protein [Myxococcales bacterium]
MIRKAPSNAVALENPPTTAGRPLAEAAPLLVTHLRGTQAEMGAQHGRVVAAHGGAAELLRFYPDLPARLLFNGLDPRTERRVRQLARPFLEASLYAMDRSRPASYRARTRAFFTAVGLPARQARFLSVMDLFQNVVGLAGRIALPPFDRLPARAIPACSTTSVWGRASVDGTLRHARNFDFPGIGVWDTAPSVVFCSPDASEGGLRYGFVTTRGADTVGVTAFNEGGIVLTAHTRFHRQVSFGGAAIVDVGHEIVRRAETLADAVRIARERRSASSWGLCVSSGRERRALVIEIHAGRVEVVEPRAGDEFLTCANRYRHPSMQVGEVQGSRAWAEHSDARERRMREHVEAAIGRGGATVEDLWALLADRRDPDAPEVARAVGGLLCATTTVKSVVVEPEAQAVWVSVGRVPACAGPWQRLPWSWDRPVGASTLAPELARGGQEVAPALLALVEAVRLDSETHDPGRVSEALERAVAKAPSDPSLRFLAGGLALRLGRIPSAREHLEAGLTAERAPFRHGQLLLWASRAADAGGDAGRARALRGQLAATTDARLDLARADALRDAKRPWNEVQARKTRAHLHMSELGVG